MALAPIKFRILSDLQRIDLLNRIIVILTPLAENDETIAELLPVLQALLEKLKAALAWSAKSELSDKIDAADAIRDDALIMISATCRLNRRKSDQTIRESAILLGSLYDEVFKDISLNSNSEETTGVELFLEKTAPQPAVDAFATLQLEAERDALKTSQAEYIRLVAEREGIKAGDETPRLVPTRRELTTELNHLVSHMEFKERRGSSDHISAVAAMNEPIKAIVAAAKAEETRKEHSSEE